MLSSSVNCCVMVLAVCSTMQYSFSLYCLRCREAGFPATFTFTSFSTVRLSDETCVLQMYCQDRKVLFWKTHLPDIAPLPAPSLSLSPCSALENFSTYYFLG